MSDFQALLQEALQANQLNFSPKNVQTFADYLAKLQQWNRVFNLTTITHPRDMVYLHILDSLAISPFLQGDRLLDVGSGAGLPGIPLAIANPHQHWTLLDKNGKKTRFLTQAIAELNLTNVSVVQERCEDFHPPHGFDSILSRAFGTLRLFIETTRHLLQPNGIWIAMKGRYPQDELNDIPNDVQVLETAAVKVTGIDAERHVVRIKTII